MPRNKEKEEEEEEEVEEEEEEEEDPFDVTYGFKLKLGVSRQQRAAFPRSRALQADV